MMTDETEQNQIIMDILKKSGLIPIPETKTLHLHYKNFPDIEIKNVIVDKTKTVAMFPNARKKLPTKLQSTLTEFDITKLTALLYFLFQNGAKKISIFHEPDNALIIVTDNNIGTVIR